MSTAIAFLLLITAQVLLASQGAVQAKRFFGVGQRIEGDQLLLKDVQHSRPGSSSEPASVTFTYDIVEPITYIQIISEENISAEVKFSYVSSTVVGMVRLMASNITEFDVDLDVDVGVEGLEAVSGAPIKILPSDSYSPFDVLITIFGFNQTMLNVNPALLLNRDTMFEGELKPYDDFDEFDEATEPYDYVQRDDLQVDIDKDEQRTDKPTSRDDFEFQDKIIEIGQRQEGDDLIYDTYQTSSDVSQDETNHTVVFYYIDSNLITYVKFVIFDHFTYKEATAEEYMAPVVEYSHYSPFTLKATITNFNSSSLFVQMFLYGYRGIDKAPKSYKPYLDRPHTEPENRGAFLTPLQRMQLLLLTGRSTTGSPTEQDSSEISEEDGVVNEMPPEDMVFERKPEPSVPNAVLDKQRALPQRLYAMLGLMLFAVA